MNEQYCHQYTGQGQGWKCRFWAKGTGWCQAKERKWLQTTPLHLATVQEDIFANEARFFLSSANCLCPGPKYGCCYEVSLCLWSTLCKVNAFFPPPPLFPPPLPSECVQQKQLVMASPGRAFPPFPTVPGQCTCFCLRSELNSGTGSFSRWP